MPDIPSEELIRMMRGLIADSGGNVQLYVKWTCPNCGERVVSTTANVFHKNGYLHEDCGHLYTGDLYGLLAVHFKPDEEQLEEKEEDE